MSRNEADLLPVLQAWVRRHGDQRPGTVEQVRPADGRVEVKWFDTRGCEWVPIDELEAALQPGWTVQDVPSSSARQTMGVGKVVAVRRLGGRDQALVQFAADGRNLCSPA